MKNQKKFLRKGSLVILFFLIAGIAYLPNLPKFGYFNDDWYLMYAANANGPGAFEGIYSIDRPARASVMAAAFSLFGMDPLYYNLSAFLFRVLGAFAFLWTVRTLWPRQTTATAIMALLFLIYPGFLSTPNAIDYQAQQISLFLALVSIAVSVQAILESRLFVKILLWLVATVTAVAYLGLVEYFLGMEVFRLGLIFVLVLRASNGEIWQRMIRAFSRYAFFAVGPLLFLIWRFFIFESERKATDIGAQFSQFGESPLLVLVRWGVTLLQDSFESIFLTWEVPLSSVWNVSLRLREMFLAGMLVSAAVGITLLIMSLENQAENEGETSKWRTEALWLGLISVIAGLVPVALSNREAGFYYFSRYMLASSAGTVIFVTTVIYYFNTRLTRQLAVSLLVVAAVLTHHLNGVSAARATEAMRNFWWQVSWRVPQLRPETTLVANYSHASIEEDYFVWGPANLIYYPESSDPEQLKPVVGAAVLTRDNLVAILNQEDPKQVVRRSIITSMNYDNILIVTQPFNGACVQIIDGKLPLVSGFEQYDVMLAAASSNLDSISYDEVSNSPPTVVFGQEPEHGWCYYYEKAALAYQKGNWQEVLALGGEARKKGFSAIDPVEWMPFIQAAAILGDQQEILGLAPRIKKEPFLARQACEVLSDMPEPEEEMKAFIAQTFCNTEE
jgi:hypothetical protein